MLYKDQIFNRLKIVRKLSDSEKPAGYEHSAGLYECMCRCGNKVIAQEEDILSGHTKSCGCLKAELLGRYAKSGERERKLREQGRQIGTPVRRNLIDRETGRCMSLTEWAREFGISRQALHQKLKTRQFDEIINDYRKENKNAVNK